MARNPAAVLVAWVKITAFVTVLCALAAWFTGGNPITVAVVVAGFSTVCAVRALVSSR